MTEPEVVVRASTPAQWLTTVPYLLGFHPRESIVVLGVGGASGKRITLTTRVDICAPEHASLLGEQLLVPLLRSGAGACQLFLYRDAPGPLDERDAALVHDLCDTLAAELEQLDHVAVLGDRWYALDPCPNPACCAPEGAPLPEPDELIRSELVYAGLGVLPSRDALVRGLAPIGGPAEVLVAQRCGVHEELMLREVVRGGGSVLAWGRDLRTDLAAWLERTPVEPLPTELLARFLVGCTWLPVRDGLLVPIDADRTAAVVVLSDAVRRSPRSWVAGPATLLGLVASLQGDGALANVAFDVALGADPGYRFALLLSESLSHGIRMPDDLIRSMRDPLSAGSAEPS